jgi:uncharacterized protein (TIGR02300 family)
VLRPELVSKRICPTTGKKFYDLGRDPVISPYTGEAVPTAASVSFGQGSASVVARKQASLDEEEETDGPEFVSLDEVEAEEADQDTSGGDTVENDALVVDEDDEDTTDLVELADDDDE